MAKTAYDVEKKTIHVQVRLVAGSSWQKYSYFVEFSLLMKDINSKLYLSYSQLIQNQLLIGYMDPSFMKETEMHPSPDIVSIQHSLNLGQEYTFANLLILVKYLT